MNDFLQGPQHINTFINFHKLHHINYCEVIIYPNGDIEYCIPSHQETLLRACKMNKDEFMKICINNDVLIDLCNKSKCVAVWYNLYINPNEMTDEQFNSLISLKIIIVLIIHY